MLYKLFIYSFVFFTPVYSHLILNIPQVWGIIDGIALEQPITTSSSNWLCAGNSPPVDTTVLSLIAGNTYNFQTICGEKNFNLPGCLIGDWHSGDNINDYSGCVLAISYSDYKIPSTHKYISYSHDCPKKTSNVSFTISKYIQNCDKCVCSWGWAPSIDYSSPQFYHNCFYCKITNGIGNIINMKNMDFINVQNSKLYETTYNQLPNLNNIYNNNNNQLPNLNNITIQNTHTKTIQNIHTKTIKSTSTPTETIKSYTNIYHHNNHNKHYTNHHYTKHYNKYINCTT